jgi:hypothetical protein
MYNVRMFQNLKLLGYFKLKIIRVIDEERNLI